jgi:hypothetical protein
MRMFVACVSTIVLALSGSAVFAVGAFVWAISHQREAVGATSKVN